MSSALDFPGLLRQHAEHGPDRVALRTGERALTWAELDAAVDSAQAALLEQQLPESQGYPARVAIVLPNTVDFVISLLAVLRAGLVAVPVNPGFTDRELDHVLRDSGAQLVIDASYRAGDLPGSGSVAGVTTTDRAEQLAVLLYTSGTEGAPKGAMLTHRALIANHRQLATIQPPIMSGDDTVLLALPLFHAYGLNSALGAMLWYGACGVLEQDFHPQRTAELIAAHQVTVVGGAPPMYRAWAQLPGGRELLGSVRLAVCGAAALDAETAAVVTAQTGLTVQIGYGLTETAPVLTSTLASRQVKPGSIGQAIPGVELRLVNAFGPVQDDDPFSHPDAGDSDPGEIVVRGDNLFSGYWPGGHDGPDADGWWPTRDVAYADDDGDLFLVDRLAELILVNGFNVYPAEVEHVLAMHPEVAEAAVLGVPDQDTGEAVSAYVVAVPGSRLGAAELAEHCAQNLARFKCPASFAFVAQLPHSVTGKVRKRELPR